MALKYEPTLPEDPGPGGDPGNPSTPPTQPGTRIAFLVTSSSVTITEDQIIAAGGPWPAFTFRVTPVNDTGSGPPAQVSYPDPTINRFTEDGTRRVTEAGDFRNGE